jgi:hypothetical protein
MLCPWNTQGFDGRMSFHRQCIRPVFVPIPSCRFRRVVYRCKSAAASPQELPMISVVDRGPQLPDGVAAHKAGAPEFIGAQEGVAADMLHAEFRRSCALFPRSSARTSASCVIPARSASGRRCVSRAAAARTCRWSSRWRPRSGAIWALVRTSCSCRPRWRAGWPSFAGRSTVAIDPAPARVRGPAGTPSHATNGRMHPNPCGEAMRIAPAGGLPLRCAARWRPVR